MVLADNLNTFEFNLMCNLWGALGKDIESLPYNMVVFKFVNFLLVRTRIY